MKMRTPRPRGAQTQVSRVVRVGMPRLATHVR